jgi:hypothetical protein
MATPAAIYHADAYGIRLWMTLVGGVVLVGMGLYGIVTGAAPGVRYGLALGALGLSGAARVLSVRWGWPRLLAASHGLTGTALGLLISGFLDHA